MGFIVDVDIEHADVLIVRCTPLSNQQERDLMCSLQVADRLCLKSM